MTKEFSFPWQEKGKFRYKLWHFPGKIFNRNYRLVRKFDTDKNSEFYLLFYF